jgi:YD repeat-containing protein
MVAPAHRGRVAANRSAKSFTYDLNGDLTGDGAKTYEWDAANRLMAINAPGNLRSEFSYNGSNQWVKIVEMAKKSPNLYKVGRLYV